MMAEQLLQPNLAVPSAQSLAVDELFEVAATGSLEAMLRKALGIIVRLLGAEAGSILFQAQSMQRIQSGVFRPEALTRIKHWEGVISERLANT